MRRLALSLALGAVMTAGGAVAQDAPADSIAAVYSEHMFWTVEDGGAARFRTSERDDYRFTVTHEEFLRLRDLAGPFRDGVPACEENPAGVTLGHVAWRVGGVEQRSDAHWDWSCPDADQSARMAASDRAYHLMRAWGEARHQPPPGLPAPDRMTLTWLYWGNMQESWDVPRGGEATWSHRDGRTKTFAVSAADFDRVREVFRPWEGVRFKCERVIADLYYGRLVWSQAGHEDQQLNWDRGCTTGDATDVFRRVDEAEAMLAALRDAS